jgi:hypothetical protein
MDRRALYTIHGVPRQKVQQLQQEVAQLLVNFGGLQVLTTNPSCLQPLSSLYVKPLLV